MLPVAEHLTAQHSAIKMLHSRVKLVLQYVRAVQAGELPKNHEILREAYSLSHRLPVLQSSRFRADFYNVSLSCGPSLWFFACCFMHFVYTPSFIIPLDQELHIKCCRQVNHFVGACSGSSRFKAWLGEQLSGLMLFLEFFFVCLGKCWNSAINWKGTTWKT
jgi:hypothetical protein